MHTVILAIHVLLAAFLVTLIMLQQGKGADMGAVMGSGGANSLFGVSGASNLLVKMTTIVAIMFMFTSIMLVRMSSSSPARAGSAPDLLQNSVMKDLQDPAPQAPAVQVTASATGAPEVEKSVVTPQAATETVAPQQTSSQVVSTPAASSGK